MKQKRSLFEPDWKEQIEYVSPYVYSWDDPDEKPKRARRYTSRPTNFLATLISGLIGYTISPNLIWLKLTLEEEKYLNYDSVRDWLETIETVLFAEFNRSNLYSEAPLMVRDAATVGHGTMLIDEDLKHNRVRYTTRKCNEVYIDVDEYGVADTLFRETKMTVRQAVSYFGYDNVSPETQHAFDEKTGRNNYINILHAVYPRLDRNPDIKTSTNMPFASVFVDQDNKHILQESGYETFPYSIFTWERIPGSAYGNSPAASALPDILILNQVEKARLRITQLSGDPAYNVPEKMRGSESVVPGGINYYKEKDMVITPINTGMNFPITISEGQNIEQRIKDWFHVDFFLMLEAMQKNRTATEVVELQGEKAAVLSTLIVNLNNCLATITTRTFNILYKQGKIPDPPACLQGANTHFKIDFLGPLAQAQKRYHQSGGVSKTLSIAGPIIQMNPETLDNIDTDELLKTVCHNNGFPERALRESKDVKDIRARRAAVQQQQQQMAQQDQLADRLTSNFNKLNEPVKQGSALEEMSKQMAGSIGGTNA